MLTPIAVKLTWANLSYTVAPAKGQSAHTKRTPRVVVHPCSGIILPREAIAIMGPSGAGWLSVTIVLAGSQLHLRVPAAVHVLGQPDCPAPCCSCLQCSWSNYAQPAGALLLFTG